MRVVIFTRLTAKPGKRDELRQVLDDLTAETRAEPGNEMYVVHEARDEPGVNLGYEVFRDDDALEAYRATSAVAFARELLEVLLAAPHEITYARD